MTAPTGFWNSATTTKREFTQNLMNSTLMQNNTKSNLDEIDQLDGMVGYETDNNRLVRSNGSAFSPLELILVGTDANKPAGNAANNGRQYYASDTETLYIISSGARHVVASAHKFTTKTDSNQSISSTTTSVTITNFAFPIVAGASYDMRITVGTATNSNAGINLYWITPSNTYVYWNTVHTIQSNVLYSQSGLSTSSGSGAGSFGYAEGQVNYTAHVTCGTTGFLQMGFSQVYSQSSSTTIQSGYTRMSGQATTNITA